MARSIVGRMRSNREVSMPVVADGSCAEACLLAANGDARQATTAAIGTVLANLESMRSGLYFPGSALHGRGGRLSRGGLRMRFSRLTPVFLGAALALVASSPALAQGHVFGTVKAADGHLINGATVTAENPNASPSSVTATTDAKGQFSFLGLRGG